jgi:hypothetical protein
MLRMVMRAVVFAFLGIGFATPALANGQVENAMQLWYGDLRTAYNDTIRYYKEGNIDASGDAAEKLQDLTERMSGATSSIRQAGADLTPELGTAWSETQSAMAELADIAETVAEQIGHEKPDLDDLTEAFEEADEAVNEAWAFTKNFGKQYGELVGGPLEKAKTHFQGPMTASYNAFAQYLTNENYAAAKEEIKKLSDLVKVFQDEGIWKVEVGAKAMSQRLSQYYEAAKKDFDAFNVHIRTLGDGGDVGRVPIDLGKFDEEYANANAAIVRVYKDFWDFGDKFRAICDDWR